MAYLNHDSSTVVVDAVLTKKGRELLSKGAGNFQITKFALSDDEVDYSLWNPDHTSGSSYYGEVIENLPLLEATVDETKTMRFKLVTLDKDNLYVAQIEAIPNYTMASDQGPITIVPVTNPGLDEKTGYTLIADDSSVISIQGSGGAQSEAAQRATGTESTTSITQVGTTFLIYPKTQVSGDATTTITVIGNSTGATTSFTVTVQEFVATNAQA